MFVFTLAHPVPIKPVPDPAPLGLVLAVFAGAAGQWPAGNVAWIVWNVPRMTHLSLVSAAQMPAVHAHGVWLLWQRVQLRIDLSAGLRKNNAVPGVAVTPDNAILDTTWVGSTEWC